MEVVLYEDAFEELLNAFIEAGAKYDVEHVRKVGDFSFHNMTFKLWKYEPTAEQIAAREAFYKTPFGQIMLEQAKRVYENFVKETTRIDAMYEKSHGTIGSVLRIRLPNDYTLTDGPKPDA